MSSTHTRAEVQEYLDRMRAALADLPDVEISEIMDDAGAHVVEVADELGEEFSAEALTTRLGTPEVYAHELRVAAGYPPASSSAAVAVPATPVFAARFAFWALVAGTAAAFGVGIGGRDGLPLALLVAVFLVWAIILLNRKAELIGQVGALPEAVALRTALEQAERGQAAKGIAYLKSLQPAWWLARAVLIAISGLVIDGMSPVFLFGLVLAGLALVSGPKAKEDRRWLWVSLPAAALAAGTVLFILGSVIPNGGYSRSQPAQYLPQGPSLPGNIYVFDQQGRPLTDVYLYDEDGQPIVTSFYGCDYHGEYHEDRDDNRYPRPQVDRGNNGSCREITGVPFAVAVPASPAPPTTSPSGSASATVDPSSSVTPPSSVSSSPPTVPTS
ncbi:HAAS signaling domain-containing protein [Umezawaea sp. Da 62-37]|uniref:DUF1700 domain-containing protein n=1 Tax=Umezawaea sp. Da 62-37 TaxID=3075927 RepID=UPI0028F6E7B7|nr:hypothetical protein [Umezawaea sp. Da 62-37]WNV89935.1 hypothetical protein RM788_17035 [Umezawaea sp. Da 62-37]